MAKSRWMWWLLPALAVGGWLWGRDRGVEGDRVENQLWLAALPKSDRDMVDHLVLIDHERGRFGVGGRSSTWRHEVEIFKWAREQDQLMRLYPQTRKLVKGKVRAWSCKGDAPRPFDLCLEIAEGGATRRYYSREEWVVQPGSVAESLEAIARETPELAAVIEPLDQVEVE
ncbi:MAG: hypothetical protein R3B72_36445 [Polyangiaceae bacterium]